MKLWPQMAFLLFVGLRLYGVLFTPQKCNNDDAWDGMASYRPIDNAARLSHILSVFQTSADVAASYHVHFCRLPMLIVHFNQLFVRTVDVIYNFNCD